MTHETVDEEKQHVSFISRRHFVQEVAVGIVEAVVHLVDGAGVAFRLGNVHFQLKLARILGEDGLLKFPNSPGLSFRSRRRRRRLLQVLFGQADEPLVVVVVGGVDFVVDVLLRKNSDGTTFRQVVFRLFVSEPIEVDLSLAGARFRLQKLLLLLGQLWIEEPLLELLHGHGSLLPEVDAGLDEARLSVRTRNVDPMVRL